MSGRAPADAQASHSSISSSIADSGTPQSGRSAEDLGGPLGAKQQPLRTGAPRGVNLPKLQMPGKGAQEERGADRPLAAEVDEEVSEDEDSEQASVELKKVPVGNSGQQRAAANGNQRTAGTSSAPERDFGAPSEGSNSQDDAHSGHMRQRDDGDDIPPPRDPSNSWHDTLLRFPSLIHLYPLADSSEFENGGGGDAEDQLNGMPGKDRTQSGEEEEEDLIAQANAGAAAAAAALAEPDRQGPPVPAEVASPSWRSGAASGSTQSSPQAGRTAPAQMMPEVEGIATARAGSTPARHAANVVAHRGYQRGGGSAPCTPAQGRGAWATPHSVPCRGAGGAWARQMPNGDLAMAWSEVEQVRDGLLQRERELAQREAVVRRAESRNAATARQLGELRLRLDDYSAELEQGVVALTSRQEAVQEERRQTLEMQARVRRMCAAAVRDDVVASKARDWQGSRRGGS